MAVNNVLCEYLVNPIGLGIRNPRITWNDLNIVKQKGFEISYKVNGIKENNVVIYTDKMNYTFDETFNSRDYVEYQIRILDQDNKWHQYSDINYFEMGLLNKDDWQCQWIKGNALKKNHKNKRFPVDYFKKTFSLKDISKARLYITSCGLYQVYINNALASTFYLAPGSTDYRIRLQYQTYNCTNLLKEGENEIVVLLGDGWYRGSIGAKGFTNVFGKETKLFCQLEVFDKRNQKEVIISDSSWSWSNDGKIRFADLKDGEIIDNRLEATFNQKARVVKFDCNLTESNNSFIKIQNEYPPVKKHQVLDKTIYEFENNIAGILSFKVNGKSGDKLKFVLGEMLDEKQDVTLKNIQCKRKNKLTPLQEIIFICKDGINNYLSTFFYAGFKYVSVSCDKSCELLDIKQVAISTELKNTSFFNCSNSLINIFYQNTLCSLKSNTVDIPTDCPTRERMGWTGDSQVFFETASFLTNYQAITRKHLVDVFDRQFKDGRLPQIAPFSAEDWFMNVMNGSCGWADVGILTPYRFYKKYGDNRLIVQNYQNIKKYVDFIISRVGRPKGIYSIYAKRLHLSKENRKYQINTGQSYGEWAEPTDVKAFSFLDFCEPHPEESMAYAVWMLEIMDEICEMMKDDESRIKYRKYHDGIKKAYQELVTKEGHLLDTNRQAKLVRPLYLKLLTKKQEEYAKNRLIEALEFYNYRLGTGFLSTPLILYVLENIDIEVAYKLLENEEMPGWLYMAKNNTGTIWESWEGPNAQAGIASLNHYSKGAMVEWLFKSMAGINIISDNCFKIKPIIGGNIKFVEAGYQSIYGNIKIKWQRIIKNNKEVVVFDLDVPSNTLALFSYKDFEKELSYGSYHFEV